MPSREEFITIYCAALNGLLVSAEVTPAIMLPQKAIEITKASIELIDLEFAKAPGKTLPSPPLSPHHAGYAPPSMPEMLTAETLCPICLHKRSEEIPQGSIAPEQCLFLHYRPHGRLPSPE